MVGERQGKLSFSSGPIDMIQKKKKKKKLSPLPPQPAIILNIGIKSEAYLPIGPVDNICTASPPASGYCPVFRTRRGVDWKEGERGGERGRDRGGERRRDLVTKNSIKKRRKTNGTTNISTNTNDTSFGYFVCVQIERGESMSPINIFSTPSFFSSK